MVHVGLMEIDLHLPTAHSLKERRSLLKGPIERARDRFNVSIIETADQNGWQSALLAAVCVANNAEQVQQMLEQVALFFEGADGVVVVGNRFEML